MTNKKKQKKKQTLSYEREQELIASYRSGDLVAHRKLQSYLHAWFFGYFLRHTGCPHTAEESLNLLSLKLDRVITRPVYPIRGRIQFFSVRLATWVHLSHIRKISRRKKREKSWILKARFTPASSVGEAESMIDDREWLETTMHQLNEQQRKVLRMYCSNVMSAVEIAEQLGMSDHRVRQIRKEIINHLSGILKSQLTQEKSKV